MAAPAMNLTPLAAGRRVAVLPSGEASGATIGYYGTVLSVFDGTVRRNPQSPDYWRYRVYVHAFKCEWEVLGRDLVALGRYSDDADCDMLALCSGDSRQDSVQDLEVRFDAAPAEDNEELRGAYRSPEGEWSTFKFKKRPQPFPTYKYRARVCGLTNIADGVLSYKVPATDRLDRGYVVTALAEVLGNIGEVKIVDVNSEQ